jgi:hypothetical protein
MSSLSYEILGFRKSPAAIESWLGAELGDRDLLQ